MFGLMSDAARWNILPPLAGIVTLLLGLGSAYLLAFSTLQTPAEKRSIPEVAVQWPVPPRNVAGGAEVPEKKSNKPMITQSEIVTFARLGAIRVEAIEQIGKFPQMAFVDANSRKVIFRSSITDSDGWLKPTDDEELTQPFLRFRVVRSHGFPSPLIMAIAVTPGGSDCGFYLTVFGERNGKIAKLTDKLISTAIQGGFYIGFLNQKFGYGLVAWSFDWDFDAPEGHYDYHHYSSEIYILRNGKFRKILTATSKRRYDPINSYHALRELGIKGKDVRRKMPEMKDFVEVDL